MKKEIFAAVLLTLIILSGLLNCLSYHNHISCISKNLSFSGRFAGEGDFEKAQSELAAAAHCFADWKPVAGLFTPDDALADIEHDFLMLRACLSDKNIPQCSALYAELLDALDELHALQCPRLSSIF